MGFYYGLAYRLFDLGEWICLFLCWLCLLSVGDVFLLGYAFAGVIGSLFSGPCSHLLVVSTHSTGWSSHGRAGSEGFSLGIAGWTVVGVFG